MQLCLSEPTLASVVGGISLVQRSVIDTTVAYINAARLLQRIPPGLHSLTEESNVSQGVYGTMYKLQGENGEDLLLKTFERLPRGKSDQGGKMDGYLEQLFIDLQPAEFVPAAAVMHDFKTAVLMPKLGRDLYHTIKTLLMIVHTSTPAYIEFACAVLNGVRTLLCGLTAQGLVMIDVKLENVLIYRVENETGASEVMLLLCDYGALSEIGGKMHSGCTYGAPEYQFASYPNIKTPCQAQAFVEWQVGVCAVDMFIETPKSLASIKTTHSEAISKRLHIAKKYRRVLSNLGNPIRQFAPSLSECPNARPGNYLLQNSSKVE